MSDPTEAMPRISVADILDPHIDGCEAFEAFLDRVETENRPYLVEDVMGGHDFVVLPHAMWVEMRTRLGDSAPTSVEVAHDVFAAAFKASRGALGPDHDLEI